MVKIAEDNDTKSIWLDPDEAPEVTAKWFGSLSVSRGYDD